MHHRKFQIYRPIQKKPPALFSFTLSIQWGNQPKIRLGHNFWLGGPFDTRSELHFARSSQGYPTWPYLACPNTQNTIFGVFGRSVQRTLQNSTKIFFRNNMIAGCIISQSWSQCGLSVKLSCLPALPCTCPRSYLNNQVSHLRLSDSVCLIFALVLLTEFKMNV